ncbi:hypothetical protein N2152v2_003283 [Parachlorella kessleri]
MDLRGEVALVTGATGGIGEECAAELAGMGATVVLGVRSVQRAAATLERIRERFPKADVVEGPPLDMANPQSIRAFADEYICSGRELHILVNNAGALTFTKDYNKQGVPELCQVNHLGPYLLTRLLEGVLLRSAPARIVNVSSVTHRYGVIGDPWYDFLRGPQGHSYENTKLANVLFAYELQRRLGRFGVQAVAVDPGSVRTSIWRSWGLMAKATELIWAPASVGARPLVVAATSDLRSIPQAPGTLLPRPWARPQHAQQQQVLQNGSTTNGKAGTVDHQEGKAAVADKRASPQETQGKPRGSADGYQAAEASAADPRYLAPEAFTTPLLTGWYNPEGNHGWLGRLLLKRDIHASSLMGTLKQGVWIALAFAVAGVDWPVRQLSKGKLFSEVVQVESSPLTYDAQLASQLWNASADVAGIPREVQIPQQG